MHRVRDGGFEDTSAQLAATVAKLSPERMRRDDAAQIVDEYRCAVEMADIGAAIGSAKYARVNGATASKLRPMYRRAAKRLDAVVPEYERLWLGRNRPGGMRDSVARITGLTDELRGAAE